MILKRAIFKSILTLFDKNDQMFLSYWKGLSINFYLHNCNLKQTFTSLCEFFLINPFFSENSNKYIRLLVVSELVPGLKYFDVSILPQKWLKYCKIQLTVFNSNLGGG